MDFIMIMARPTRKTSRYAGEMAEALSVAVTYHRDGGLIIPRTVLPNLSLTWRRANSVFKHSLRDVCDGNWRVIAAINPKKYRAEADWLHRGVSLWQALLWALLSIA